LASDEQGTLDVLRSINRTSIKAYFTAIPPWLWLVQLLSVSLFQMSFFVFVTDYAHNPDVTVTYVALGNAMQSVAFVTVFAVCSTPGTEKHIGTLSLVISTPTGLFTFFIGKAIFQIFAGMLAVLVSLGFAALAFGLSFGAANLLGVALLVILVSFAMTGFGLMIGSMGIYLRSSMVLASIMLYIGVLFCGVNFPVSYLPEFLQPISYCLPLTYGISALRDAMAGASLANLLPDLILILLIGMAMLLISFAMLRKFEKLARQKGTLDMF
jgi:ABC-2 type transport system permease protein